MTTLETIRRFAEIARPEIRRDHAAASCVASAWVTIEVMVRLGYKAEAVDVVASVGNAAYAALWSLNKGPARDSSQFDDWCNNHGAWVVGVGHDQTVGGIGGHVICVVEDRFVVDASLDQVMDSCDTLIVPPVLFFEIDPDGLPFGIMREVRPNIIFVEYVRRPSKVAYRQLPDWGNTPEVVGAAARILQLLSG